MKIELQLLNNRYSMFCGFKARFSAFKNNVFLFELEIHVNYIFILYVKTELYNNFIVADI